MMCSADWACIGAGEARGGKGKGKGGKRADTRLSTIWPLGGGVGEQGARGVGGSHILVHAY